MRPTARGGAPTTSPTFHDAGNEIKKSKGPSAENWNYLHDHRNQLAP
jgi:hypothetical protein